eukprot:Clim_evm79s215 gene=Clim_evmTU79s215
MPLGGLEIKGRAVSQPATPLRTEKSISVMHMRSPNLNTPKRKGSRIQSSQARTLSPAAKARRRTTIQTEPEVFYYKSPKPLATKVIQRVPYNTTVDEDARSANGSLPVPNEFLAELSLDVLKQFVRDHRLVHKGSSARHVTRTYCLALMKRRPLKYADLRGPQLRELAGNLGLACDPDVPPREMIYRLQTFYNLFYSKVSDEDDDSGVTKKSLPRNLQKMTCIRKCNPASWVSSSIQRAL